MHILAASAYLPLVAWLKSVLFSHATNVHGHRSMSEGGELAWQAAIGRHRAESWSRKVSASWPLHRGPGGRAASWGRVMVSDDGDETDKRRERARRSSEEPNEDGACVVPRVRAGGGRHTHRPATRTTGTGLPASHPCQQAGSCRALRAQLSRRLASVAAACSSVRAPPARPRSPFWF